MLNMPSSLSVTNPWSARKAPWCSNYLTWITSSEEDGSVVCRVPRERGSFGSLVPAPQITKLNRVTKVVIWKSLVATGFRENEDRRGGKEVRCLEKLRPGNQLHPE